MTQITITPSVDAPPRPYDFNAGDERRIDQAEAIARATQRAYERGVSQIITRTPADLAGQFWVIQDGPVRQVVVGSEVRTPTRDGRGQITINQRGIFLSSDETRAPEDVRLQTQRAANRRGL